MHVSFSDQQESIDGNLVPAVSELADKLWKRLLPEKKPQQITRKKITCLDSRRKKKKAGPKLSQGKQKEEEKLFILEIMLFFFSSYRLLANVNFNVSFVASVDYFPLEKHDQILLESLLDSGLWGGRVVAAYYKDPVIKKLPSVLY